MFKRLLKVSLLVLMVGLMVGGCEKKHQTLSIYNTWVCENRKGPILDVKEGGPVTQYNKQSNHDVNYFTGGKSTIKRGQEALNEIKASYPQMKTENIDNFYSIKCKFDKYVDMKGEDQSHLIKDTDQWWYAFQIVGNGRAEVMNLNTAEKFYMEVESDGE